MILTYELNLSDAALFFSNHSLSLSRSLQLFLSCHSDAAPAPIDAGSAYGSAAAAAARVAAPRAPSSRTTVDGGVPRSTGVTASSADRNALATSKVVDRAR